MDKKKKYSFLSVDKVEFEIRMFEKLMEKLGSTQDGLDMLYEISDEIIQEDLVIKESYKATFIDGLNGYLN